MRRQTGSGAPPLSIAVCRCASASWIMFLPESVCRRQPGSPCPVSGLCLRNNRRHADAQRSLCLHSREIRMAKRIVICADGTWNRPEGDLSKDFPTNVVRLARAIRPRSITTRNRAMLMRRAAADQSRFAKLTRIPHERSSSSACGIRSVRWEYLSRSSGCLTTRMSSMTPRWVRISSSRVH